MKVLDFFSVFQENVMNEQGKKCCLDKESSSSKKKKANHKINRTYFSFFSVHVRIRTCIRRALNLLNDENLRYVYVVQ